MKTTIKYSDRTDKSYGIAGMAISLFIYDGEDYIASVSLDSKESEDNLQEPIEFTPEFFFSGNPRLSPKNVWNHMLKQFEMTSAMTISNVLCRARVNRAEEIDREMKTLLSSMIIREAVDTCSLEQDEAEALFSKTYTYLDRVFSHREIQRIARNFATELQNKPLMTRDDVFVLLRELSNI